MTLFNTRFGIIFMHIPKTAGTSIRQRLRSAMGTSQELFLLRRPHPYTMHETVPMIRKRIGDRIDEFRIFAFVRNPFDRIYSFFRYFTKHKPYHHLSALGFDDFCQEIRKVMIPPPGETFKTDPIYSLRPQIDYMRNGLDWVGHYESLEEDWRKVCEHFKLPSHLDAKPLPKENVSRQGDNILTVYSNQENVKAVRSLYLEDFMHFGYPMTPFKGLRPSRESGPFKGVYRAD